MALPNPFNPPPNLPLLKDPTADANWRNWLYQLWKRVTALNSGTVTSVALTMPTAVFDVAGSPVTDSGTLAVTLDNQTNNTVWAGPATAPAAAPTFRALVSADLPAGTGTVT